LREEVNGGFSRRRILEHTHARCIDAVHAIGSTLDRECELAAQRDGTVATRRVQHAAADANSTAMDNFVCPARERS
jgi:hypothetical protein